MKNNYICIVLVLLSIFIATNLYAQEYKEKNALIGEEFSISVENDKDGGRWELYLYDSDILELIEDRKNSPLKTTLIFYPKKIGNGDIVLNYIQDKSTKNKLIYKILVKEKTDETTNHNDINESEKNDINTDNSIINDEDSIKKTVTLIKALIERELYDEALGKINTLKDEFVGGVLPKDILILEGECLSNIDNPDYEQAIIILKKYLDSVYFLGIYEEGTAEIHLKIAYLHYLNGNYNKSEYYYIEVLTIYQDNDKIISKAYLGLADVYIKDEEFGKAINDLENALPLDMDDWVLQEILIRLSRIYFEVEEYKDYDLSYKYYSMIDLLFPEGKYKDEVKKRLEYLSTNFINYGD